MIKIALSVVAVLLSGASLQAATITAMSATSVVIGAPASVTSQSPGDDVAVLAFTEQENVLLDADLLVEDGFIAAGTRIDSHMVLFNPVDDSVAFLSASFDFQFSQAVLGKIEDRASLTASHALLGAAGTTYGRLHGLEGDDVVMLTGGTRLSGILNAIQPGDWFRVITASAPIVQDQSLSVTAPVPLPATGLMLALGLGAASTLRRRA